MTMLERATTIANQMTQRGSNGGEQQGQKMNNLSPFMQAGLNAIMSGDATKGEEIANNILKNAGVSREQAMNMARQMRLI